MARDGGAGRLTRTRILARWYRRWGGSGLYLTLEWKLPDLWVGAFYDVRRWDERGRWVEVWVCLLPTLPIHIHYEWEPADV